jgi:hypothetical protein
MKPREEYDKEALLVVVADLEQIGRNLLFARRNIWFYLFMCVYICVACVRSHSGGEALPEKEEVQKSAAQTARSPTTTNDDIIK